MPALPDAADLPCTARGDGPPVILVHGWSLSSAVFEDLAGRLARAHRVILPELRGHGAAPPRAPFGLADLAGDLVALAERLDLRGALLCGWSLGAQVALAALPGLRGRLSGLALLSGTPRFTAGEGWPHGLPPQAVEVLGLRVRRDPARALGRFFEGMFVEGELDAAARSEAAALRARIPLPDPEAARCGLQILATADLRGALATVDLPTVVIHGDADPICLPGAGRALADGIRGARLTELPGAGHAPFLSRPAAVLEALGAAGGAA